MAVFLTTVAVAFLFSGCAARACGSGEDSGEDAVAGLIAASRHADEPEDVCAFVASGYTVSAQDLADLRERYSGHPDDALDLKFIGQLGSTAQVTVTDGGFADEFEVTSDSDSRWTVAFGTLFG